MATNNFVTKKDVTSDDGDDKFESRYVITNAAIKRIFSEAAVGRRSGGDLHLSAIFFIMGIQMNLGRYCIPDLGKTSASKPDLTIFSPKIIHGDAGRDLYNPSEWSEDIIALEVEATPGKHISQILINWEKCTKIGYSVWFIVFTEKDMQIVQKALSDTGIDKKNYALQILDKNALDDSINSTLGSLTEVQSVIYEILISAGGEATQNTIIEKAYKYDQKDVINALTDLHSKKRLVKTGNPDANLQNPGAKIMWSLPKGEHQDKKSNEKNNSTQVDSADILKDSDKEETMQDNVLEHTNEKTKQTAPEIISHVVTVKKNNLLENDKLSKDSLDSLTEFMLLSIWESYIDNNDHESAKRISDEINSRGFVIRERNGDHHISKKPTKKKKF